MIKLRNVSFEYQLQGATFRALEDVSLNIEPGDFVAIIGASGSGKTTLMNVIGLMATPTSGEVELGGARTAGLSPDELATMRNRKLGFIFQHFNLLARLSVLENILLPAQYVEGGGPSQAAIAKRAQALIHTLGLAGQEDKAPALLSGGQKQRVAIARALLLEPDVLLADEPTGALDSVNTARVLDILDALNARGKTIVVITHDARVAARAKRIVRIHDGRIVGDERNTAVVAAKAAADMATSTGTARVDIPFESHGDGDTARTFPFVPRFVALRQAIAGIAANPVRAALTVFGLSIGVSSIIIMLTLTEEARGAFKKFFDTAGGKAAYISFDGREAERLGGPRWQGLLRDSEFPALNRFFSRYGRIDPRAEVSGCQFRSGFRTTNAGNVNGIGALAQFGESEMKLAQGRFFTPSEIVGENGASKVAILGKAAAENLFPSSARDETNPSYPLGERLTVRGGCQLDMNLVVVGVLEEQDSSFDDSINASLWAPTVTLRNGGLSARTRSLSAIPNEGVSARWFADSIMSYLSVRTDNRFPFRSYVPEQQIARVNMMLGVLGGLTVVVGGLCTLIGGIGVMNIMLVNIAERVREIGIRKAVGAQGHRIRNQFIVESTLLCLASGLVGIVTGLVAANLVMNVAATFVPKYLEAHFVWSTLAVTVALVSSIAAGFGFGLMPARRAAAMDVVEALRQD